MILKAAIVALLAALGVAVVQTWRLHGAWLELAELRTDQAEQVAANASAATTAEQLAREIERVRDQATGEVAASYQRGLQDAANNYDRNVADLRSDNIKLRQQWRGCEADRVPALAGATGSADAAEHSRQDSAARVVRAADTCDAQVTGLQAFILAEREP